MSSQRTNIWCVTHSTNMECPVVSLKYRELEVSWRVSDCSFTKSWPPSFSSNIKVCSKPNQQAAAAERCHSCRFEGGQTNMLFCCFDVRICWNESKVRYTLLYHEGIFVMGTKPLHHITQQHITTWKHHVMPSWAFPPNRPADWKHWFFKHFSQKKRNRCCFGRYLDVISLCLNLHIKKKQTKENLQYLDDTDVEEINLDCSVEK